MSVQMNVVEQVYNNTEKIEFLLDTAIIGHLDGCGKELEVVINLLRDVNNMSKEELHKALGL